jgi:hypothetical protein
VKARAWAQGGVRGEGLTRGPPLEQRSQRGGLRLQDGRVQKGRRASAAVQTKDEGGVAKTICVRWMGARTTSTVILALIASKPTPGSTSRRGVRKSLEPAKGSTREGSLTGRVVGQLGSELVEASTPPFSVVHRSAWEMRFCQGNTIGICSLRLFSESPPILQLFGARRLSQQDYPFFPEP